ncbi:MAG: hypothetical protein KGN02_08070 [bacterium]|nr:hypothetical protein [bacterium]
MHPRQRSLVIALFALVLALSCARAEAAAPPTTIRLHADRIAFYYDRYLIEADGHVRVTTSDGTTLTGDTFSMDLKLNRFLIASNVTLRSAGGNLSGAAIADFLAFKRVYFVPVLEKPDRWTYENGDFEHPIKGRQMPGDTFYFPDLSNTRLNLTAKSATIGSNAYVRFGDVTSYVFGAPIPLPSFYVYFGTNQDLAQNSLSGANLDLTWNATGNNNSITALHVRRDTENGSYLSLEQHLAGAHEYAVFSVNPGTKFNKFWNLNAADRIGKNFQLNVFEQLYTQQHGLRSPSAAASSTFITLAQALPHSYLQAAIQQTYYNLIGPSSPAIPNHPMQAHLYGASFNQRIFKTPFYEQIHWGFGFNHDTSTGYFNARGLQDYGGVVYTTIWDHSLGYTVYLPEYKFGDKYNPYHTYYFNAVLTAQRLWYTVPHHVNTATTNFSVSRQFSREVSAYVNYNVNNTGDYYNHGGYTPYAPLDANGQPDYGFLAFRGASTLRTATLGVTYSAHPEFSTTLTFDRHKDFPAAVPGVFPLPPTNVIGQYLYSNYLGQPPYDITANVRARVMRHLMIDVQRTYYFNFGTQRWSPQFLVQFTQ